MDRLIAGHWCVSSASRGLTSVTRELNSVTCERTSERRDATANLWRLPTDRRRVPIGTVEVISERNGVTARREEASGDRRVVADERR